MRTEDVIAELNSSQLESEIRSLLEGGAGAPEEVQTAIDEALGYRDRFVEVLEPIDDEDEVRTVLAIQYIETKSRWIALNTRMNYSLFRTGKPDQASMLRGTAVSTVLSHVEAMLDDRDIETITEFLAEPVNRREAA